MLLILYQSGTRARTFSGCSSIRESKWMAQSSSNGTVLSNVTRCIRISSLMMQKFQKSYPPITGSAPSSIPSVSTTIQLHITPVMESRSIWSWTHAKWRRRLIKKMDLHLTTWRQITAFYRTRLISRSFRTRWWSGVRWWPRMRATLFSTGKLKPPRHCSPTASPATSQNSSAKSIACRLKS